MKIKNKIIVGGLMSVVSCALVGSITGTFAWYQVSNKATVSMHGKSVGATKNLELKVGASGTFKSGNLTWKDIAESIDSNNTNGTALNLKPVSNGGNTGSAKLNDDGASPAAQTWWGNPDGGKDLPVASDGYIQFDIYARYVETSETDGSVTYPKADLYVTDIAALAISSNPNISNALRVHINFGDSAYCLFNPFKTTEETITLSATISSDEDPNKYDWTTAKETVYQLPQTRVTAAEATEQKPEGSYKENAATQKALAHADVIQSLKADGSLDTDSAKVTAVIPASTNGDGLKITVTAWLEGFAPETTANNASNWWTPSTTIGTDMQFGFQLAAFKNANQ